MVALNLDLSTTAPSLGGAPPVKDPGWYIGMIVDTQSKPTKDTEKGQAKSYYLEVKIAYQDGSNYVERYNIWHETESTKDYAKQNLAALVAALGISPQIADTTQMHNIPFEHFLAVEEAQGNKGVLRNNRLTAVKSKVDGKVYGQIHTDVIKSGPVASAAPKAAPPTMNGFAPTPAAPVAQPPGMPAASMPLAAQPWGAGAPGAAPTPAPAPNGFPAAAPPAPAPAPAAGGFAPPAGGFPAPGGFPVPGAPPPVAGGFAPPAAAPWGGPAA